LPAGPAGRMIFCGGVLPLSLSGALSSMNVMSLQAGPAAGLPLPDPSATLPRLTGFRRVASVTEGVVYWGILALGAAMPFVGALYGLLRS